MKLYIYLFTRTTFLNKDSYSNLCMHCMFLFLRGCQSLDIQNDPTIKIALCPNVLLLSIYFPHVCIHFCKIITIL
jgi:hypothetical protein